MNIEEARKHIGKEVVLDGSTKPYALNSGEKLTESAVIEINRAFKLKLFKIDNDGDAQIDVMNENGGKDDYWNIGPRHLKLKEKPMNYKIRVTPEISKEVQELFFALGFEWGSGGTYYYHPCMDIIFADDDGMFFREESGVMPKGKYKYQEITLPQLRDMVMLKRNDMNDATHKDSYGRLWIIGDNVQYLWNLDSKSWKETQPMNLTFKELKNIEHISIETIINDKECQKEMTWQDALRSVTDGKEVEFYSDLTSKWHSIETSTIGSIKNSSTKFRLAPQRKTLNGKFTKEELLKIAGEME